jgi:DNA-binding Xre family transcriptional regulator
MYFKIGVFFVDVRYNKLFKLLIDKGMKKTDLRHATGISPNTLTKLSNNEYVSMDVLVKICRVLKCDVGDIMEVVSAVEN